jgi:hypothetical protein
VDELTQLAHLGEFGVGLGALGGGRRAELLQLGALLGDDADRCVSGALGIDGMRLGLAGGMLGGRNRSSRCLSSSLWISSTSIIS